MLPKARSTPRYAATLAGDHPNIRLHVLNVQEPMEVRAHAYLLQQEMGSVANKVVHLVGVPVTLVK